ncbi:MAG: HlyD family secretion protein [Asticcacaulis sp.]|nr:HlyD family secretion protein [Asticcacaulis sp.]
MSKLFRSESLVHASNRLAGEVIISDLPSVRLLSIFFVTIVFVIITFLFTNSYTRMETAQGLIVPQGGLIRLAARQDGTVETINVTEGAEVHAGDPIAVIKLSTDLTDGDSGQSLDHMLLTEALALAAQNRADKQKLEEQGRSLISRRSALSTELGELNSRVATMAHLQEVAEQQLARGRTLQEKGFMSAAGVEGLKTAALQAAQQSSEARSSVIDATGQIADLDHQIASIPADLASLDAAAAGNRSALKQRQITIKTQNKFIATAPISGRVVALPVDLGQSVTSGTTLAVVTPTGSDLIAELYLPSRAAGFIKTGQAVNLMYQAFPYQTFGSGKGRVISISRTVLSPSEVAVPGIAINEPAFRVRVALSRQSVFAYGKTLPLQPGMLLSADVVLDRRNLVQWLLDPIYAVGRR